jgi:hypothetical protein
MKATIKMSRSEENRRYHLKVKSRPSPLADVPQIPSDLAGDAAYNNLSDADEARMSASIKAATSVLRERRTMKEDVKKPYTPREFATVECRHGLVGLRSVAT